MYRLCKNCRKRLYRNEVGFIDRAGVYVDQYYLPKGKKLLFRYFCDFKCWHKWHVPEVKKVKEIKLTWWQRLKRRLTPPSQEEDR